MIDRRSACAALPTALTDAIASDYRNVLRIHHYVDALPGWAPTPAYCHDQVPVAAVASRRHARARLDHRCLL